VEALRYPYRPKTGLMALVVLFFGACAWGLSLAARDNDRGVVINHMLTLDPGAASVFYWALAAASVLFVLAGLYGIVQSLRAPGEVAVDAAGITLPAGRYRRGVVTIPFASITDLGIQQVQSQKFLIIKHAGGRHSVARSMMPGRAAFEELVAAVTARHAAGTETLL
jgi:hypothetical protein